MSSELQCFSAAVQIYRICAMHPVVVTGWTLEYLGQRGFNVKDYAISREMF